jgi:hypothetical protein
VRYFIIKQDEQCPDAPNIINWFGKLDVRKIKQGASHALPRRLLLPISSNPNTVFTDVVSVPFLLYSERVMRTVGVYESSMVYKQVVLLDGKNQLAELYFLPILKAVDCLSDKSELNRDASVIRRAVLLAHKLPDRSIFRLGEVNCVCTIVRLDLAESLLRRGVRGISLHEVEIDSEN